MKPDLKDLSWTLRLNPRVAKLPSVNIFWFDQADLILLEPKKEEVLHRHKNGATTVVFDLTDVMVAIDFDPEARRFFLDLACWLLLRCVEGEFGRAV